MSTRQRATLTVGLGVVALFGLSGALVGGEAGVGYVQWIGIVLGLGLTMAGFFGPRTVTVYRDTAVLLLNTVLFVLLLELAAAVTLSVLTRHDARSQRSLRGAHADTAGPGPATRDPAANQLARENTAAAASSHYEPFVVWTSPTYRGALINVGADHRRVTPGAATPCPSGDLRLHVYGGSAAWGYGVADSATIPAFMQRLLNEGADRVCVTNHAQSAYVSTQELIALIRQLQRGDIPEIVLLYDGFNDAVVAVETGRAGAHYDLDQVAVRFERREARDSSFIARFAGRTATFALIRHLAGARTVQLRASARPARGADAIEPAADSVVRLYLQNVRMVEALSRAYGFRYQVVVQPTRFVGRKPVAAQERALPPSFTGAGPLVSAVYQRLAAEASRNPRLSYFGDVFDSVSAQVYRDEVHLNADGNRIVAGRIIDVLRADRLLPVVRVRPQGQP